MKLVFYSLFLNHHQAGVADELYAILGDNYRFVELSTCNDSKGGGDYSTRPYLVKAWQSKEKYNQAMVLAKTAEVCVFSGYESLPFQKERLKTSLLSFDMGERLLKRGWLNLLSPRIFKISSSYYLHRWREKSIYKLCCSAFTSSDCNKLGMFKDRCYKWGYFTPVDNKLQIPSINTSREPVQIMWCARFLTLKHPELVIELAKKLKNKGYDFHIDIFGDADKVAKHEKVFPRNELESLIKALNVEDCVSLKGNVPNSTIIEEMKRHHIFLFTSDKKEGWGAVANESMANGCVLVASDAIGSSPYLVKDGYNGFLFKSCDIDSLTSKVEWLLNHPTERYKMQTNAMETMRRLWNPRNAANSLLRLIDSIENGRDTEINDGPCSKA